MSGFSKFMKTESDGAGSQIMQVGVEHLNDHGTMHGGAVYGFCMEAVTDHVAEAGKKGVAIEGSIHYYRPAFYEDRLRAKVSERKPGRRMSTFLVELFNQDDKLIADSMISVMWGE